MITANFYTKRKFTYPVQKFKKLVKSICKRFGVEKASVEIAIVDNNHIRKLNSRFLNRRKNTDCLAFDLSESKAGRRWFELIVNGEKAVSEAKKRGHSPQAELALYITHGLLHNLGFDDLSAKKAKIMHRLEDEILQQQGFGTVFENRIRKTSRKNAD
jgi:probable rRNA maturation factor